LSNIATCFKSTKFTFTLCTQKWQSLFDNRTTPIANGAAPLIKGEIPDVKRTYMLRASTVRKLNELKSIHPNINVCVSTIVDLALDHYYKHIKEGGIQ